MRLFATIICLMLLWQNTALAESAPEATATTHFFNFGDTIKDNDEALALRTELERIVKAKDAEAILAMMHPRVRLSFGSGDSMDSAGIRKALAFDDKPEESPFWQELERILPLGGTADAQAMIMPWLAAYDFPETDWTLHDKENKENGLLGSFVTLKETPLFKESNTDSAILRMLKPYETLLIVIDDSDDCETYRTHDGLQGCVNPQHVRSPLDYRIGFRKEDGKWLLKGFIAGD